MRILGCIRTVCIILSLFLIGCSMNANRMVSRRLDSGDLNNRLGTQTIDLSVGGECPGIKSLGVTNGEARTDNYCINEVMGGCRWYIIPRDFTNDIVKYIENRLTESKIKLGSDNMIIVSLEELKSQEGVWTFGSSCKIRIQIPEINYSQAFVGESGGALGDLAAAYAIHIAVDNFFKDPVFQNFIKCH
jgi:hypothetical protein